MAKFTARTTAPSSNSKYYYKNNPYYQSGYGMPNCTCYAFGRFWELTGGDKPTLSLRNAESWWKENDGYKRGQTPKLGAVMCWRKGVVGVEEDGAGHVAIVEKIYSDGTVLTSNSAWKGTRFYTKEIKPPYSLGGSYAFQGFIYLPIEFEDEKKEPEKTEDNVYIVKKGDTLGEIASKYGTTYQKLATYNGITNPHLIYVGQKIKIPSGGNSVAYSVYTVKKGDTLAEIAELYKTTYQKLAEYNKIENPNLIYPGQQIKIPK